MEKSEMSSLIETNRAYRNIVERTSVRRFTDEPVTDLQVQAILHAAMSAPSGVNKQPWEFVVVEDKEILKKLAESLPYAKMTADAPVAIVVCGNPARFLEGEDSTLWEQDLSASSENILLAAHALGLGGVWTCLYPHIERMDSVRKILSIGDDIVPFNLIPIGHPLKEQHPMDKWHPERVHYNKY